MADPRPVEIRSLRVDDLDAVLAIRAHAFAIAPSPRQRDLQRTNLGLGGFLGAEVGGELVGILNVHSLGQHYGGRAVAMGGVASVAVVAEHRGRGVAPQLLGAALHAMRERGQVISTLHPATTRLYRTAGWELAGDFPVRSVPARSLAQLPAGHRDRLRRGGPADISRLRDCYARVAPWCAGWIDRPDGFWDPGFTGDDHGWYVLVCDSAAGDAIDGYALYEQSTGASHFTWKLTVHELVAVDAVAERTLWRGIGSNAAQVDDVTVVGGSAAHLPFLLPEQDLREVEAATWMARLVDAAGAVAARAFPVGVHADVQLAVADPVAPWNDGRWVLTVDAGRASLEPGGNGRTRIGIGGLGALYTGFASAHELAAAGLLHGDRPDLAVLDAAFAGPRPTMLEHF